MPRPGMGALAAVTAVLLCASVSAQEGATFKVDVNVVNVLATVRDRDGRIAGGLTREDFILEENGKRQEIRYFARQSDLPLTIGLLVDTSMSQRRLIDTERSASRQFFEQVLRPEKDTAFVIQFDVEVLLLQDLTNSRELLEAALRELKVPDWFGGRSPGGKRFSWGAAESQGWPGGIRLPGGVGGPGRQRGPGGGSRGPGGGSRAGRGVGTALHDAVFLAADEVLKKQEGRKAIILISDGVDHGSKVSGPDSIEASQRADAIVYSVRYYDAEAYRLAGRNADGIGERALAELSKETGGRLFEVSKRLALEQIFGQVQEELRNQYSLGYTPADARTGGFRQIKLRTTSNLTVQTRTGYYSKPSATGPSNQQEIPDR